MSEAKKFELSQPVAIVIAGIIIAGAILLTHYFQPTTNTGASASNSLPANVNVPPPSSSDHIIGSPNAPIVLIEYSDFQCPYCQLIYPTLKQIVSESNGQIAWVMRNFPLYQIHPQAEAAANAAECIAEQAGNTGYWKFADADFNNQSNIGPAFFSQEAQSIGVNMQQYNACVSAKKYQSLIDSQEQVAEGAGGNGTPYTIVYGHGQSVPISGALPYSTIMSVIQGVEAQHS